MSEIVKTFGEIFICFLAAVGILYLLRDLYLTVYYRKRRCRLPLFIYTRDKSFEKTENILSELRIILQNKRAASHIGRVYIVTDEENTSFSTEKVEWLKDNFSDIADIINIDEAKEIVQKAD